MPWKENKTSEQGRPCWQCKAATVVVTVVYVKRDGTAVPSSIERQERCPKGCGPRSLASMF